MLGIGVARRVFSLVRGSVLICLTLLALWSRTTSDGSETRSQAETGAYRAGHASSSSSVVKLKIGALFDIRARHLTDVFQASVDLHNHRGLKHSSNTRDDAGREDDDISIVFEPVITFVDVTDSFAVSNAMCDLIAHDVMAIVGVTNASSLPTIQSYSATFHVPFLSLGSAQNVTSSAPFQLSLRPPVMAAVVDLLQHQGCASALYMYDSDEGLMRIQDLFQAINIRELYVELDVRRIGDKVHVTEISKIIGSLHPRREICLVLDLERLDAVAVIDVFADGAPTIKDIILVTLDAELVLEAVAATPGRPPAVFNISGLQLVPSTHSSHSLLLYPHSPLLHRPPFHPWAPAGGSGDDDGEEDWEEEEDTDGLSGGVQLKHALSFPPDAVGRGRTSEHEHTGKTPPRYPDYGSNSVKHTFSSPNAVWYESTSRHKEAVTTSSRHTGYNSNSVKRLLSSHPNAEGQERTRRHEHAVKTMPPQRTESDSNTRDTGSIKRHANIEAKTDSDGVKHTYSSDNDMGHERTSGHEQYVKTLAPPHTDASSNTADTEATKTHANIKAKQGRERTIARVRMKHDGPFAKDRSSPETYSHEPETTKGAKPSALRLKIKTSEEISNGARSSLEYNSRDPESSKGANKQASHLKMETSETIAKGAKLSVTSQGRLESVDDTTVTNPKRSNINPTGPEDEQRPPVWNPSRKMQDISNGAKLSVTSQGTLETLDDEKTETHPKRFNIDPVVLQDEKTTPPATDPSRKMDSNMKRPGLLENDDEAKTKHDSSTRLQDEKTTPPINDPSRNMDSDLKRAAFLENDEETKRKHDSSEALILDCLEVLTTALTDLWDSLGDVFQSPEDVDQEDLSTKCTNFVVEKKQYGSDLMEALKLVHIYGETRYISFDTSGKRADYTLSIMSVKAGSRLVRNEGDWSSVAGLTSHAMSRDGLRSYTIFGNMTRQSGRKAFLGIMQ